MPPSLLELAALSKRNVDEGKILVTRTSAVRLREACKEVPALRARGAFYALVDDRCCAGAEKLAARARACVARARAFYAFVSDHYRASAEKMAAQARAY